MRRQEDRGRDLAKINLSRDNEDIIAELFLRIVHILNYREAWTSS